VLGELLQLKQFAVTRPTRVPGTHRRAQSE
jgi:hypothetical protein